MTIRDLCEKLTASSDISQFLKPSEENEKAWKELTKLSYDFLKQEEKELGLQQPKNVLKKLYIEGMEAEQIWQQIELQNHFVMASADFSSALDEGNLCFRIAKMSNSVSQDDGASDTDEGVESGIDEEDVDTLPEERSDSGDVDDDSDAENKDLELDKNLEDSDSENNDDIDFDEDTYGDLALEGKESDSEGEVEEENDKEREPSEENLENEEATDEESVKDNETFKPPPPKEHKQKFGSTVVDSQFLNLRESEWVADNDLLGEGLDASDSDDIDFMEDLDSGQSDNEIMYDQFFDVPDEADQMPEKTKKKKKKMKVKFSDDTNNEPCEQEPTETEHLAPQEEETEAKSRFDLEIEKEDLVKESLVEENYILEKPWALQGEVSKDQRPENSALEEPLEYNIAVSEKPVITEDTSQKIEKLILSRIRNQNWDDVERKLRPKLNPGQYKERLVLDQEKSEKDLAKIYEEEFLRKQEKSKSTLGESCILGEKEAEEEEPEVNKVIRAGLSELFTLLDALSNYHFTPKPKRAELKVVTNMSAITLEEATPAATSDAGLLAPQEIVAPLKGNLKGSRERTSVDKKRERRAKKLHQKKKAKFQEEKLKEKMKKKGKDGFMQQDASIKFVQKAIKKGQVKMLKPDERTTTSSFFSQLEEQKSLKRKSKEMHNVNKGKKIKNLSSVAKVRL